MIDLHCHTNISDNNMSIAEIVKYAKDKGITHLGITDHDTTMGLKEAKDIGLRFGVEIIPGIEISAYDYENEKRVHILGYFIDPDSSSIKELCDPLSRERHEVSIQMIAILKDNGFDITLNEVESYAGKTGIFKQHIMHCLKDKGYTNAIYSPLYKKLFKRGKDKGMAYIPLKYVDYKRAINAVKLSGGIPVIAHIGQFDNFNILERMIDEGLMGIEVKHPDHDNTMEEKALSYAKQYDLLITGGSDFHGMYSNHNYDLGSKSVTLQDIKKLIDFK